jgi:hypothetical protein
MAKIDAKAQWRGWLEKRYPGANIVDNGQEMIAEVEPGLAIAVITRSIPHFHLKTTETYRIIEGALAVIVAGRVHLLEGPEGEAGMAMTALDIYPRVVHHAVSVTGIESVVEVRSNPPWSPDDHFEV